MSFACEGSRETCPQSGFLKAVAHSYLSGLAGLFLMAVAWPTVVEAQNPNADFEDFLLNVCVINPPAAPSQELIDLCVALFPGGGAGADPGLNSASNTGNLGAQGEGARANGK